MGSQSKTVVIKNLSKSELIEYYKKMQESDKIVYGENPYSGGWNLVMLIIKDKIFSSEKEAFDFIERCSPETGEAIAVQFEYVIMDNFEKEKIKKLSTTLASETRKVFEKCNKSWNDIIEKHKASKKFLVCPSCQSKININYVHFARLYNTNVREEVAIRCPLCRAGIGSKSITNKFSSLTDKIVNANNNRFTKTQDLKNKLNKDKKISYAWAISGYSPL